VKRSPQLRDLSEDHHYGLTAARRLRRAAEGHEALPEAVAAFLAAWEEEIAPHFRQEEEILLPAFARRAGAEHELIVRTLTEHVALRRDVSELELRPEDPEQAAEVARALHDHIRFEERRLFPAIEAALAGAELERLGEELCRAERPAHRCALKSSQLEE
jgi:iron-sulfur cluster repair protein YtfE (RIC family)